MIVRIRGGGDVGLLSGVDVTQVTLEHVGLDPDGRQIRDDQQRRVFRADKLAVRHRAFDDGPADRRANRNSRLQVRDILLRVRIEAEHLEHFLRLLDLRPRLGQLVFGLLQGDARSRLMFEEVLCHGERLLSELEVFVAGQMIGDGCGNLAAAEHEEHVALSHAVAGVHGQVLYLARNWRQNPGHSIGIEFDGAGRFDHVGRCERRELFDAHLLQL